MRSHFPKACPHLLALIQLALVLVFAAVAGRAQSSGGNTSTGSPQIGAHFPDGADPTEPQESADQRHLLRQINAARQKSMVSDAVKLLALARLLNSGVAPDGSAFTDDQRMRLAAEIEKLAHSIKGKMAYAVSSPQAGPNPFRTWPQ
jgi:hypothetical protein